MNYSDDAFAAMLLTMALSPNKEEYARPLNNFEFGRIRQKVRESGLGGIGRLLNQDIGALMMRLDIPEEEAYRIYTLLNRGVQISRAIENYYMQNISVMTSCNDEYPASLKKRLDDACPPVMYTCGNTELLSGPMLAIVGISGVKTTAAVRAYVEKLILKGIGLGYSILTGGELGVSHLAMNITREAGGNLVEILGGGLKEHIAESSISEMLEQDRAAVISLEHPEAMFTIPHAIARNKTLFSLAEAAFIFSTDGKRGEMEAKRNRYCDWMYAFPEQESARQLIDRGIERTPDIDELDLTAMCMRWKESESEQLNLFDMF